MFSILFSSIRFLIGICAVGFIWIWVVQSADDQLIFVHAVSHTCSFSRALKRNRLLSFPHSICSFSVMAYVLLFT